MALADDILRWAKQIQPQKDRILCRYAKESRKVGSVWLPDGGKSLDVIVSQVVSRGPDVRARLWELAPGDFVLHVRTAGLKYDGTLGVLGRMQEAGVKDADFVFLFEKDILAVVDPESVGSVVGQGQYSEGRTGEWHQ